MGLIEFLRGRARRPARAGGAPLLAALRARVPPDGAPGLLPASESSQEEAELRLGERFATELHSYGAAPPFGLGRRVAAAISAAQRRRVDELAEALGGLMPWELPAFLEALSERAELPVDRLVDSARALAERADSPELLAAALGTIGLKPTPADLPLFVLAGRSPALAGVAAMAAEPLGTAALLQIAQAAAGLGRALALERLGMACADRPEALAPVAPEALRLAATIEDPTTRAWAAVPLLEVGDVPTLLHEDVALADAVAACLEAAARGGWNGGPGPGLGRMPGGMRAAEALIASAAPRETRLRGARAVLDSHPLPPGNVRRAAEALVAEG